MLASRFNTRLFRKRKTIMLNSNNSSSRLLRINYSKLYSYCKNSKSTLKMLTLTSFLSFYMLSSNRCKWDLLKS